MTVFEKFQGLPPWMQKLGAIAGILVALFGAISGYAPAMNALDAAGLFPASTKYVRDENKVLQAAIAGLTIDSIDGKIEAAQAARNKLELDKLGYDAYGQIKAQQEMSRLSDTIDALREKKRNLRGERLGPN